MLVRKNEGMWTQTCRKSKPESKELKHTTLLGRLHAQKDFRRGHRAWRHEPGVAKIVEEERRRAKARRKAQRIRLREDVLRADLDSSSDFSPDSSSASSVG